MEEEKELNGSETAEPSIVPSETTPTEPETVLEQVELPLNQPISESAEVEDSKTLETEEVAEPSIESAEAATDVIESSQPEKNNTESEMETVEEIVDDKQDYSTDSKSAASPEETKSETEKKIKWQTVVAIIIVLVVVIGVVFFMSKKANHDSGTNSDVSVSVDGRPEQGKISIMEETKDEIKVAINSTEKTTWSKTKIIAYFGNTQKNPNSADCSLTYPLEREIDKKYDSNMLNSVLGVLEPLKNIDKEKGYVSSIPEGTYLKYIKLDDSGVATVSFSGNLNKAAGSCAVTAIKSQIKDTLLQFASVKSVVICLEDNCKEDEILQP